MATSLVYRTDTYLFEERTRILEIGEDKRGRYIVPSSSNYYFGGGGQPPDKAEIRFGDGSLRIVGGALQGDRLLHFIEFGAETPPIGTDITIVVDAPLRLLHARLHTGGHLVASTIHEGLGIAELTPIKGYHYPDSPYVEFSVSDESYVLDLARVNEALREYVDQDLPTYSRIVEPDSENLRKRTGILASKYRWINLFGYSGLLKTPLRPHPAVERTFGVHPNCEACRSRRLSANVATCA